MHKSKKIKIFFFLFLILISVTFCIVTANSILNKKSEISDSSSNFNISDEVSKTLQEKASRILSVLDKSANSKTKSALQKNSTTKLTKNAKTKTKEAQNMISTNTFNIYFSEETNKLEKIESKSNSFADSTSISKESANNIIKNIYTSLELPNNYDLVYLESLDESVWEANFQKKYGDVYNIYESVKIFFIPSTSEIISLNVFDQPYIDNTENNTNIPKDDAISILKDSNLINSDLINLDDINLELVKENDFIKETNSNSIKKAWTIKTSNNDDEKIYYIDSKNGEIIGGDLIK